VSLPLQLTFDRNATPPTDRRVIDAPPAAAWPFLYPLSIDVPNEPSCVWVPDLHEAFVNRQTASTRLVTTQATYLLLEWLEIVADRDVVIVATADRQSLAEHAPEILEHRGVFASLAGDLGVTGASKDVATNASVAPNAPVALSRTPSRPVAPHLELLERAFRADGVKERLELCVRALDQQRDPATLVATASVCMEVNDLEAAARDLDAALALAPQWPAAHFERGKLWLRLDDMERASQSFRAAAERMPRFASAWANLGATLGELDRPRDALAAFERALACDPDSPQTHNNIGVVSRELGRLGESEAAFNRVIGLVPDLAFGYYNLGHTLFLQGRYQAALSAYVEGQKRDPERNAVQASRLAMCRLATGDGAGALAELKRATGALPRGYRQQLLADTQEIAWALLTHRPDLPGWQHVNDWLMMELGS
jgi:tetratricopeptide (TPR) repeat protein